MTLARRMLMAAAGAATEFSPLDYSPLGWWDASDTATITESSGAVSQWNDKSGNARHLAQSTAGAKPTTGSNTQNSLNVITFDGGDFLTYDAGSDAIDMSPLTWFCVCYLNTTIDAYARTWTARRGTAQNDYESPNVTVARQNTTAITFQPRGTALTTISYTVDTFFLHEGRADGTDAYHSVDGGSEQTAAVAAPDNMRYIRVGGDMGASQPPGDPAGGSFLSGRLAEIILYNSTLDATQRANVRDYLQTKWGI